MFHLNELGLESRTHLTTFHFSRLNGRIKASRLDLCDNTSEDELLFVVAGIKIGLR